MGLATMFPKATSMRLWVFRLWSRRSTCWRAAEKRSTDYDTSTLTPTGGFPLNDPDHFCRGFRSAQTCQPLASLQGDRRSDRCSIAGGQFVDFGADDSGTG